MNWVNQLRWRRKPPSELLPSPYLMSGKGESRIVLYPFDKAPPYVTNNSYIRHGYRADLSISLCLRSIFTWNNDTFSIWSHLLGFFYFIWLMYKFNFIITPTIQRADFVDIIVGNISLFTYQIAMVLSALYHCFYCQSAQSAEKWLGLDLSGITAATTGGYISGISFAFQCFPFWRNLYIGLAASILILTLALPTTCDSYLKPEGTPVRVTLHIISILFGILPLIHFVVLLGFSPLVMSMLWKVVHLYSAMGISFSFYMLEIPERFFPGYLDFFGQSHHWWHIGIFYSLAYWHNCSIKFMQDKEGFYGLYCYTLTLGL